MLYTGKYCFALTLYKFGSMFGTLGDVSRLAHNSSSEYEFKLALLKFVGNLVPHGIQGSVIYSILSQYRCWNRIRMQKPVLKESSKTFALVLHWHPMWGTCSFQTVLDKVLVNFACDFGFCLGEFKIRLSWKNGGPPMKVLLRKW